jgi:hypothetical protein
MKSLERWSMVFALLSLAAFALAACGGGGGGSSAAPDTTTATPTAKYAISGTVTSAGTTLQGVTIKLISSSGTTTTISAADGTYSFTGLANGSYMVVPSLAGHSCEPVSLAISVSNANVTGKNVMTSAGTAVTHSVSGVVSGAMAANVMLTLNGDATGSVFTDSNGKYSISGLPAGTYTLTPSLAGYSFGPAAAITITNGDSELNNFVSVTTPGGSSLVFAPATSLPQATVGTAYTNSVVGTVSGGSPPYHFQSDSFATGAPPLGMIVDLNGKLTGTPSVAGSYTFGVCAVDMAGASSCGATSITVNPAAAPLTCAYTYSAWSTCQANTQTRTVISSSPVGCFGTPVLSQACSAPVVLSCCVGYFDVSCTAYGFGGCWYQRTSSYSSNVCTIPAGLPSNSLISDGACTCPDAGLYTVCK